MHDLASHKVQFGVHCLHLRHKGMYVMSVQDPDEGKFYDPYDSAAYWCIQTLSGFGPDGHPVRPDCCGGNRDCCQH
jgi:hypothetical protein